MLVCTGQPVFRTAFLATFRRTVAIVTGFLIVKHAIQLLQTQFLARLLTSFSPSSASSDDTDG